MTDVGNCTSEIRIQTNNGVEYKYEKDEDNDVIKHWTMT